MNDSSTQVDRPIFVIGTGRSGTTLLFKMLTRHPDLAWLCQYVTGHDLLRVERFLLRLTQFSWGGDWVLRRLPRRRPIPEPYDFWRRYFPGFNRPGRDLRARDVLRTSVPALRDTIARQVYAMGRARFLGKYTGWSRIGFMDAVFPGVCCVDVVRDGRAVAASLLQRHFWEGWRGPAQWRWGPLSEADAEIWKRSDESFFVLAGLQWKLLMENLAEKGPRIGDRYVRVRYEDLVKAPVATVEEVLRRVGLRADKEFLQSVERTPIHDATSSWKKAVTKDEIRVFEELLGPALRKFGY
jgi:hypothetical protein